MKKYTWILFFLLLAFLACDDDDVVFEASTEGLELSFRPVAGGAMMYYTLPNNRDIFAMNVRYVDSQGQDVLKVCDYGGDSLLLDGFTRAQEVIARISFVNQRNEESASTEYRYSTYDSAPWAFFDDLQVRSAWNGFEVIYTSPEVVTGMAHVFYLGNNPLTHQEDTILVKSFPISRRGDTLNFKLEQKFEKNTVVVRTEDFQGYRVRQEIFPGINAFWTEQWKMTADRFNDGGLSVNSDIAKTGVKYLFDGELKGKVRMAGYLATDGLTARDGIVEYGTYVAGPQATEKPLVLDLGEEKVPAWIRLYCHIPMTQALHPAGTWKELGTVWNGWYDDKIPCKLTVYGNRTTGDPEDGGWERLGGLDQEPKADTPDEKWSYLVLQDLESPKTMEQFEQKKPVFVDVQFPAVDNNYRYLKIVVHEMFKTSRIANTDSNPERYFTLHELEVFVKKN